VGFISGSTGVQTFWSCFTVLIKKKSKPTFFRYTLEKRYYIAYGSNLNIKQMKFRCPTAKVVGTSEIHDYRLLFKGSQTGAYLTIEPCTGSGVPVAVWEVTADDELSLDSYEGNPQFYYKTEMTLPVTGTDGKPVGDLTVFVYIMHEDRSVGIPMQYYVDACLEGYRVFGFDEEKISDAIKLSLEKCHHEK
jgi:hypothetical protein